MSRIGKRILNLLNGVEFENNNNLITIKGKLGTLTVQVSPLINVEKNENQIIVTRSNENKHTKQLHGTTNSLLNNMIIGVSEGFKKEIEIKGVGYRSELQGNKVILKVGYSHSIEIPVPNDVKVTISKPTEILIEGIDKQKVGQLAAVIREVRKPSPYSGKGIMYKGEFIRRKEGKAASK